MSSLLPWDQLGSRIAGKWQIPLLGLSLVTLPLAIHFLRPNPSSMPLVQVTRAMEAFVAAGAYDQAVEVGQVAVAREDCQGTAGAPVHLAMARALFGAAQASDRRTANVSRTIAEHYRQAAAHSLDFSPDDYVKLGKAFEWGKQYALALQWMEEALAKGYGDRLALLRHMYLLRRNELKAEPEELTPLLEELIASAAEDRPDVLAWGLEERLGMLAEASEIDKANALLAQYQARFTGSDFANLFDYFNAWVLFQAGALGKAELDLRSLRNRVPPDDPVSAKAGWLLGRVMLADAEADRLEEALSFFRDVLTRHPAGPYAAASRIGAAEALAALGKHAEATELYRFALEDLSSVEITGLVSRSVIRASLSVMAEHQRQSGDVKAALDYAELVQPLVDWDDVDSGVAYLQQLGRLQVELAEKMAGQPDETAAAAARATFSQAAETYLRLADIDVHNDERASDAAWKAAELYARAGARAKSIDLHRLFAESRPGHPLVPRALLRIGQLHQAAGRLTGAIAAYQECYRRFPKLLDGIRALVPMAQCYILRGPDDLELAEKTLRIILEESDVFTPEAPEFADALFLLGDVFERLGQYEKAIATLSEAIDRYPADARVWRARFLLADSYRQSASALKQEATTAEEARSVDRVRDEANSRFGAARRVYRELIDEYELRRTFELNPLERIYLRHAYLYEADCYFEAQLYRDALRRYDQVAGLLRGSPSVLAAYVQIINCHVFLGEAAEGRAALARAQVLADRMNPETFENDVSPETKDEWKEYFEWLGRAEIF
jgi:tetratricopeptide (TPR) repeat protein